MATGGFAGQPCGRVSAAHWGPLGSRSVADLLPHLQRAVRYMDQRHPSVHCAHISSDSRCGFQNLSKMADAAASRRLPRNASSINTSASASSTVCPSGVFSATAAFSRPRVWALPFGLPLTPERKPLPVMPPSSFASFRCSGLLFTLILTVAFVHSQHEIESPGREFPLPGLPGPEVPYKEGMYSRSSRCFLLRRFSVRGC